MSKHRKTALFVVAGASLCTAYLAGGLAPKAVAGDAASWNGHYLVTVSADAKTGTSMAARDREYAQKGSYSFTSSCSSGSCVATVTNPPPPKNQYMPRTIQFTWNGSAWVREISWRWECRKFPGLTEYDPAKSTTIYTPGPNGVLTGIFHTDILSGACQGTVEMPVSAKEVHPAVV